MDIWRNHLQVEFSSLSDHISLSLFLLSLSLSLSLCASLAAPKAIILSIGMCSALDMYVFNSPIHSQAKTALTHSPPLLSLSLSLSLLLWLSLSLSLSLSGSLHLTNFSQAKTALRRSVWLLRILKPIKLYRIRS